MTIEVSDAAKAQLIKIGWDPTLGARPLRRAVQHEIEDALSERILHGELNGGDHVAVDYVDGEFTFVTTKKVLAAVEAGAPASAGELPPVE